MSKDNKVARLSEKNEERYQKMIDEVKQGKVKVKSFTDISLLIKELRK